MSFNSNQTNITRRNAREIVQSLIERPCLQHAQDSLSQLQAQSLGGGEGQARLNESAEHAMEVS